MEPGRANHKVGKIGGIALIPGINRLLDMVGTTVNVTFDTMVVCIVAKGGNREVCES
jgi:Na+/H+-dicarboxylate symporter